MCKKILYCVLHTKHQKERVEWIKSTWGQNKDIIFYGDYNDINYNTYKVSNRHDYASGQEKQINVLFLLNFILDTYEWYFFCDNDTFVNTSLLESSITHNNFENNSVHGNIINHWPEDRDLQYPSGGAGFLLSNQILKTIATKVTYQNTIFSDVCIGLNFRNLEIKLSNNLLFKSMSPDFYDISLENTKNYYTFHYIKNYALMKDLHDVCNR